MKLRIGIILAAVACLFAAAPAKAVIVNIGVGDRPYYVHGPGYWAGPRYYVWVPGHWRWRQHHRVWVHGYYTVR